MGHRIERVMIMGPLAVFADEFKESWAVGVQPVHGGGAALRLMARQAAGWEAGFDVAELTAGRALAFPG